MVTPDEAQISYLHFQYSSSVPNVLIVAQCDAGCKPRFAMVALSWLGLMLAALCAFDCLISGRIDLPYARTGAI